MRESSILKPSDFRKGVLLKKQKLIDFEKPDILETLFHLGIGDDLTERQSEGGTYYNGPCPFHQTDSNNFTNFIVWPNIQRCACQSCHPEFMDAIDVWMRVKGVKFKEAVAQIGIPLTQETALMRSLQQTRPEHVDLLFYSERMEKLFTRLDYAPALKIILEVNAALRDGQVTVADRLLQRGGV